MIIILSFIIKNTYITLPIPRRVSVRKKRFSILFPNCDRIELNNDDMVMISSDDENTQPNRELWVNVLDILEIHIYILLTKNRRKKNTKQNKKRIHLIQSGNLRIKASGELSLFFNSSWLVLLLLVFEKKTQKFLFFDFLDYISFGYGNFKSITTKDENVIIYIYIATLFPQLFLSAQQRERERRERTKTNQIDDGKPIGEIRE